MLKSQGTVAAAIMAAGTSASAAEGPAVVSDIRPIHSLVSMIMDGVGEPSLLMPSGASPHGYSMTPTDARLLGNADVIVRVGPELIPSLDRNIKAIASNAVDIVLLDVAAGSLLPPRQDLIFRHELEDDDHDHDEHDQDDHGEHEPSESGHDHEQESDDGHEHDRDDSEMGHDHEEDDHEDHHGHAIDPHAWLNPDMAIEWLSAIADGLSASHPEHSTTYSQNAENAIEAIREMSSNVSAELEPYGDEEFVVYHDAYQYFEIKFGLNPIGAIKNEHAADATVRHMRELSELIGSRDSICVFVEPQYNQGLLNALGDEAEIRTGTLDPIGIDLELGTGLYMELIEGMARSIIECLSMPPGGH